MDCQQRVASNYDTVSIFAVFRNNDIPFLGGKIVFLHYNKQRGKRRRKIKYNGYNN